MRITATPDFGTTKVGPHEPITITASFGQIGELTMTGADGSEIAGNLSDDGSTWTKTGVLTYGEKYTVSGTAIAADGTQSPIEGTYRAVKPADTLRAHVNIGDDATVGIAAPIIITFGGVIKDRAAAERNLHVTVTDADGNPLKVTGSWGWMQDEDIQGNGYKQSRVHYRTKEFWPAHARVHLDADLYGVDYGSGWGRADITVDFEIGPKLIVKAEVDSHRLKVLKNDKVIRNYPVSYGLPSDRDPGRTTVSGIHIVQDFSGDPVTGEFTMSNPRYGYTDVKEYWGVRINNNGEFIHVNKQTEAAGLLGKANVSHGCINIGMKDGKEFYDMMYFGVPVDVEGTGVPMGWSDYIYDWALNWHTWKSLSAL